MNATIEATGTGLSEGVVADTLFNTLYSELHRLARREVYRRGQPVGGLGVTTVLHEAYLKMSGTDGVAFPDHARFLAYAARVMRGLIIDDIRRRRSQKRGGLFQITSLRTDHGDSVADPNTLARISGALDDLSTVEPDLAEIVDLKFFCGFSFTDIAVMRGVSERTVQRKWEKARLYLHHAVGNLRPVAVGYHAAVQP
ncbi:MAG: ECF-type sigma factor [Acidobacteriota bacterium]